MKRWNKSTVCCSIKVLIYTRAQTWLMQLQTEVTHSVVNVPGSDFYWFVCSWNVRQLLENARYITLIKYWKRGVRWFKQNQYIICLSSFTNKVFIRSFLVPLIFWREYQTLGLLFYFYFLNGFYWFLSIQSSLLAFKCLILVYNNAYIMFVSPLL